MRYMNVFPIFPGKMDYMTEEAKRLSKDVGLNEIALCLTLQPEGELPAEKHEYMPDIFKELKECLSGTGITLGILLQSLLGHGWSEMGVTVNEMNKPQIRYCPEDPAFPKYVSDIVAMSAAENPAFFLADDDMPFYEPVILKIGYQTK